VISVATTYTLNARLQKPATSDRDWDVPVNANADALDGMTAIGSLVVTTTETPSATLNLAVTPGNFVKSDGTVVSFAGALTHTIAASTSVCLWLTDSGVLTSGSSFPTSAHLRLAQVVSGATAILQIQDERIQCSVAGSGLGFVLKAGDTMTGPLTITTEATGSPLVVADPVNRLIGFFGATPALQATALIPLVSSSPGVASNTLVDVGTTFSQTVLNNNFASLAAKVDALIAALKLHGLMGS
jgi:hypothetical protein